MTDIRKYINLVEQHLDEWPFSKKVDMDSINNRLNNRPEPKVRQLPDAPVRQIPQPVLPQRDNGSTDKNLEYAKTFKSADAYAYSSANSYMPLRSYATSQAKRAAEDEANSLRKRWNLWKQQGYIQ